MNRHAISHLKQRAYYKWAECPTSKKSEYSKSLIEIGGPIIDGISGSTRFTLMLSFGGGHASVLEFEEL